MTGHHNPANGSPEGLTNKNLFFDGEGDSRLA